MENLQKYKFYLILGIVLLAYLLAYFLMVSPQKDQLSLSMRKLEKDKSDITKKQSAGGLPNENLIKAFQERKEALSKVYEEILGYLKKKDEPFETWFKELRRNPTTNMPEINEFHDFYYDRRNRLIKEYTEDTASGFQIRDDDTGKTIEEILPLEENLTGTGTNEMMKIKQKEFWIVRGMLTIFKKGKLKTLSSFSPIKLLSKADAKKDLWCDVYAFEFTGSIDYGDIPFLLEALLSGEAEIGGEPGKNVMLEVVRLKVERRGDYRPRKVPVPIEHDEQDIQRALDEFRQSNKEKLQRDLPPIKIRCQCRILDYDSTAN